MIVGGNDPADSTLLPRDLVVRASRFYKPAAGRNAGAPRAIARPDYFPYPPGTAIAATVAELGFADAASGNVSLASRSPFARCGVGADTDSVVAATAGARALR